MSKHTSACTKWLHFSLVSTPQETFLQKEYDFNLLFSIFFHMTLALVSGYHVSNQCPWFIHQWDVSQWLHPCFIVHIAFKAVFELTFLLQYESFFTKMQTRESKMPLKSRLLLFLGLGGVDSKLRAVTSDFTMGSPYCHSPLSWIQQ